MRHVIAALLADLRFIDKQRSVEAKRSLREDAYSTIRASTNEPGWRRGILLCGVARMDGRYEALGEADPDRVSNDVATACAGDAFNRRLGPTVRSEVAKGKVVVRVAVPDARPGDKPIYPSNVGLPVGADCQVDGADVRCSDDNIRLFHQRALDRRHENTIVTDATMEDLDLEVVASCWTFLIDTTQATSLRYVSPLDLVQALDGARGEGDDDA
ncbi:MAG: hypothetical protein KF901_01680 [Myxococcales bacterium]|nr:hypothetical protein [Myxococcales bacterium]